LRINFVIYFLVVVHLIAITSHSKAGDLPECGSHEAQTKLHEKIDNVGKHHNLFGEAYVIDIDDIKEDYRMCSATVVLNTGSQRKISYGFKSAPEGADPLVTLSLDYDPDKNYHDLKEHLAGKSAKPYDLLSQDGDDQFGVPVRADDFLEQSQVGNSDNRVSNGAPGNGFTIEHRQKIDGEIILLLTLIAALLAFVVFLHMARASARMPSEDQSSRGSEESLFSFSLKNLSIAVLGIGALFLVVNLMEGGDTGIEYSGEFPSCHDQKAIEYVQAAFNDGPSGMQGIRILQIADRREVVTAADRRDCSGIAILNTGSEYQVTYGFEKRYDRVFVHISLQEPLQ